MKIEKVDIETARAYRSEKGMPEQQGRNRAGVKTAKPCNECKRGRQKVLEAMHFAQPFNGTFEIGTLKSFGGSIETQPSTKGLLVFKIYEVEKKRSSKTKI